MNVKVLSEAVDNLIRVIPAVVDVECCLNKHIVNVCHLAMLICHCQSPALLPSARQVRRCLYEPAEPQKQGCRKLCS
ncbi:hypothetical protein XBI1_1950008 [Xenorhabdus bovienii str. Intermedium]|uniref:Uncharacterized protein n=1 Tax=Xenorhabdus bovienii str. Intermedium TaxID=1379677 RepID=A0A077QJE4_XENBV|nr:hypothetical protein XBI1_1950008 [Xenorhabdus bovienii str. Intermedium]